MIESHTQLKAKCLECGLHIIVCTERPETHTAKTLYCPECGQRNGQFMTWVETIPEPIYRVVPGNAKPTPDTGTGTTEMVAAHDIRPGRPKKLN